jgi:DNA-binding transcriptional regulator YhcF (GntR family)
VDNEKSHSKGPLHPMKLFVPPITLNRKSGNPLHRQIYRQIASAIRAVAVRGEARLPSTRVQAKLLHVSRNTVLAAYDDLAADNLVRAARGVGMQINNGAAGSVATSLGLNRVIRAANYPGRVLVLADPDGNPLYLNYGTRR